MISVVRFLLLLSLLMLNACSARMAVTPGDIPAIPQSSAEDQQFGSYLAQAFRSYFTLSSNQADYQRVTNITNRLLKSSTDYKDQWQIMIFNEPDIVNAAVTRGRYIFIWSGLLQETKNNDELAAVIGHEIGHYLAGHHQQDSLEQATAGFSDVFKGMSRRSQTQQQYYYNSGSSQLGAAVVGITSALIGLTIDKTMIEPEKQRHELEADTIGLFMMAQSGYNPDKAVELWQRFNAKESGREGRSAFRINSHPASEDRLENLKALLPMAKLRYTTNPLRYVKDNLSAKLRTM